MTRGIVESLHLYIYRTGQTHFSANIITLETLPISSLRIHSSFLTMGVFMVLKTGLPVFKTGHESLQANFAMKFQFKEYYSMSIHVYDTARHSLAVDYCLSCD